MKRRISRSLSTSVLALLATALVWSCSDQPVDPTSPLEGPISPTLLQRDLAMVIEVQERHTDELMKAAGVVGTAVSIGTDGEPVVTILAKDASHGAVPKVLEGVPVEVMVTGEFFALPPAPGRDQVTPRAPPCGTPPCGGGGGGGGGGGDVDPTARFDRPVPIGISTGHPDITAGTIGALVEDSQGNTYALSNNHVYADENNASTSNGGDPVIQPGTFDGGSSPADNIGNLSAFVPIVFSLFANNRVDAAIAATTDVTGSTPSDGYGTPRTETVDPRLRMRVQKYGRTTGQTNGRITAINATVNVGYSTGTARFVGQIVIGGGGFSSPGDSGSLIVVRGGADDRKPVGLLFAGGGGSTIANPIVDVLTAFQGLTLTIVAN